MSRPLRVVHYLNQFFGQIGGEDKADAPLSLVSGPVGPGRAIQAALEAANTEDPAQTGEVVATLICGDNTMAEALDQRAEEVVRAMAGLEPDIVLAGPAFGAGRYGMACAAVCAAASSLLSVPAVAGLHESNPAVPLYRSRAFLTPTASTAAGMRAATAGMVKVGLALSRGLPPEAGDYFVQGIRVPVERALTGAERAAAMLLERLQGGRPATELPLPAYEIVPPAPPLEDTRAATIVLVTEGGLTPKGNPDRIEASMATKYGVYSLEGLDKLAPEDFQAAHGGYDNARVNEDPHRLVPLDALRAMESSGEIKAVGPVFYSTAGNATTTDNAARFGKEIAQDIRQRIKGQVGVFLTAT